MGMCTGFLQEVGCEAKRGYEAGHEWQILLLSLPAPARQRKYVVCGKDPAMRRLLSAWCMWSTLGVIVLKILIVPLLLNFFPAKPHKTASLFTLSYPGVSQSLWEEPSTVSQELDRECAQQSKQALASACLCNSCPPEKQRDGRFWSIPVPISLPLRSFFPRKLPPPSTADDSFLS